MLLPVRVGSNGELQLPRQLISRLGLKPNQKVVCTIEDGTVVLKPLADIDEVLSEAEFSVQGTVMQEINRLIAKR